MWSIVLPQDFRTLVQNFKEFNFSNVELFQQYFEPLKDNTFGLVLDNAIKVLFIHYRYDANAKKPQKKGVDLCYCNIEKYIVDTWHRRTERMKQLSPHFLGVANGLWTASDISKFIELKTPFKKSLIVYDKKYLDFSTKDFKICYVKPKISTFRVAQQFINACNKDKYTL